MDEPAVPTNTLPSKPRKEAAVVFLDREARLKPWEDEMHEVDSAQDFSFGEIQRTVEFIDESYEHAPSENIMQSDGRLFFRWRYEVNLELLAIVSFDPYTMQPSSMSSSGIASGGSPPMPTTKTPEPMLDFASMNTMQINIPPANYAFMVREEQPVSRYPFMARFTLVHGEPINFVESCQPSESFFLHVAYGRFFQATIMP